MGAAGYVTIYDYDKVVEEFKKLYPENDIHKDWWYLETITTELYGHKVIFDYGDDQGFNTGSDNSFWFKDDEAQDRCRSVLKTVGRLQNVEVWT